MHHKFDKSSGRELGNETKNLYTDRLQRSTRPGSSDGAALDYADKLALR